MEYTITTNKDGSLTLSTIHNGYRVHRLYVGYTGFEAETLFHQYILTLSPPFGFDKPLSDCLAFGR